jgi:hypothetical protein
LLEEADASLLDLVDVTKGVDDGEIVLGLPGVTDHLSSAIPAATGSRVAVSVYVARSRQGAERAAGERGERRGCASSAAASLAVVGDLSALR